MTNRFTRLLLIFVAVLALVTVSTATVAYGHLDANSADESHCPLCMALHSAKQAVVAPVVALCFTQVRQAILFLPVVPSLSSSSRSCRKIANASTLTKFTAETYRSPGL